MIFILSRILSPRERKREKERERKRDRKRRKKRRFSLPGGLNSRRNIVGKTKEKKEEVTSVRSAEREEEKKRKRREREKEKSSVPNRSRLPITIT